jgi:hypothetical protein
MKMTRAQVKESLKSVNMETILLGVHSAKHSGLTAKQTRFAEEIARGETKAGAYRKAYKSKGKPETQKQGSQELTNDGRIRHRSRRSRRLLRRRDMQPPSI